ncbi:MAG TPA: hypothetical protein H9730_04375 [Candidatus Mediterraneibacter stercoripullorum]|nr:hypothetical protein [Candidatus Mediterraneibacter stercoripullorum]
MKNYKTQNYSEKIRWRIRISWMILILMIIYMIVVAELGGGDSRIVTDLADMVGDIIFFGGIIYVISRIIHNRKLLKNRMLLKEQHLSEQDERNQYLHDKSGGTVMDILMLILLLVTVTASLFNMAAFYTALTILIAAVLLKTGSYLFYSR